MRSKTQRERQAKHSTPVVKDAADRIRVVEGNKECADCSAPSMNFGMIVQLFQFYITRNVPIYGITYVFMPQEDF